MKEEKIKTEAVITSPAKKTGGKVDGIDRVEWFYMRKQHRLTDFQITKLKEATCPARVNDQAATLIRIFDSTVTEEKGIKIEDYMNLNEQPGLILYEGYRVHGRGGEFIIEKKDVVGTSTLDEKIKTGAITDVGIIHEKPDAQKWLGRIGSFMMMGGFILVLFLIAGIIIVVSLLMNRC